MGELFVFLFFGLVAVNGSYYVQLEELDCLPLLLSVSVGFLSTAILVVNNVRDLETDKRAGKRTLAVRLGRERTRTLFAALIVAHSYCCRLRSRSATGPGWRLSRSARFPGVAPLKAVRTRTDGPALNGALAGTGVSSAPSACCYRRPRPG